MSRRIINKQIKGAVNPAQARDGYFDRIIKYIPSDIVAAWVAISGIIGPPGLDDVSNGRLALLWISFSFCVVITFMWTAKQTSMQPRPFARTQVAISTLAFVVWAFALGGPFEAFGWYQEDIGSVALIIFTLGVGLISPQE